MNIDGEPEVWNDLQFGTEGVGIRTTQLVSESCKESNGYANCLFELQRRINHLSVLYAPYVPLLFYTELL